VIKFLTRRLPNLQGDEKVNKDGKNLNKAAFPTYKDDENLNKAGFPTYNDG
jgi:hypothetical protein